MKPPRSFHGILMWVRIGIVTVHHHALPPDMFTLAYERFPALEENIARKGEIVVIVIGAYYW